MDVAAVKAYLRTADDRSVYSRANLDRYVEDVGFRFNRPAIHVAGTNGKGSVAKYIAAIYRKAGLRVGLFTSPYLYERNELISVDGKNIKDDELASLFNERSNDFKKYGLTAFEMETIVAYAFFMKENVDLAVVECGMGGEVDATNIITPVLSIITDVSLEHTDFLGRSVSEIAASQAGIVKRGVPVLTGKLEDSADYAVRDRARYLKSRLFVVDDYHEERLDGDGILFDYHPYKDLRIQTKAFYQLANASLAVEAVKVLMQDFPVDEKAIREGLLVPPLPARFEYVLPDVIVDGAHNPAAVEALCETLEKAAGRPYHVLFAAFRDKNIDLMLSRLERDAQSVTITTFANGRARTEDDYFLYLADYPFAPDWREFIDGFLSDRPGELLVVTGSLAFAALARLYLMRKYAA